MVYLIYNSGKKMDKERNIYEMQCSHCRFKIKMHILQTRYSTCFCSQWLWPLLGYQPVCHPTRKILLTNFQHILQTKKRETSVSNTCIQRRTGPKISSCSTQDTVPLRICQCLWFNLSSTENHNYPNPFIQKT